MDFSVSDVTGGVALLVSIYSLYYSKGQADSAKRQMQVALSSLKNDYRAKLSEHHEKYRALLSENMTAHRSNLRELSRKASAALNHCIDVFDDLDEKRGKAKRPLRHLIHEASEMVFYAFKGQMNWQTGLNLAFRLRYFSRIEEHLEPMQDRSSKRDFRNDSRKLYFQDRSFAQERMLPEDAHFCALIEEMRQRISPNNGGKLLVKENQCIAPVKLLWDSLKEDFGRSHENLENALKENELEQFGLPESSRLSEKYGQWSATLDILVQLNFLCVDDGFADKYSNYISICLYNCALLHALVDVESWGWERG